MLRHLPVLTGPCEPDFFFFDCLRHKLELTYNIEPCTWVKARELIPWIASMLEVATGI